MSEIFSQNLWKMGAKTKVLCLNFCLAYFRLRVFSKVLQTKHLKLEACNNQVIPFFTV